MKEIIKDKRYEYKNGTIGITKFGIIVNVAGIMTKYVNSIEEAKKYIDERAQLNIKDTKKYLLTKISK